MTQTVTHNSQSNLVASSDKAKFTSSSKDAALFHCASLLCGELEHQFVREPVLAHRSIYNPKSICAGIALTRKDAPNTKKAPLNRGRFLKSNNDVNQSPLV